jgi:hypothetical protein
MDNPEYKKALIDWFEQINTCLPVPTVQTGTGKSFRMRRIKGGQPALPESPFAIIPAICTMNGDMKFETIGKIKSLFDLFKLRVVSKEFEKLVNTQILDPGFNVLTTQIDLITKIIEMNSNNYVQNEKTHISITIECGKKNYQYVSIELDTINGKITQITLLGGEQEPGKIEETSYQQKQVNDPTTTEVIKETIQTYFKKFKIEKILQIDVLFRDQHLDRTRMVDKMKNWFDNINTITHNHSNAFSRHVSSRISHSKYESVEMRFLDPQELPPYTEPESQTKQGIKYLTTSQVKEMLIDKLTPAAILAAIQKLDPTKIPRIEALVTEIRDAAALPAAQAWAAEIAEGQAIAQEIGLAQAQAPVQAGGYTKSPTQFVNPLTGKMIKINGTTAKNLLLQFKNKEIKLPRNIVKLLSK